MAQIMMFLGDFEFEIGQTGYDKLSKSWKSNIAEIGRNDNVDAVQFRGTKNQVIGIEGVVFPRHSDGITQNTIEKLEKKRGVPLPLTSGTFEFFGVFYIKTISVGSTEILAQNVVQEQAYNIQLLQIPTPNLLSLI